NAMPTLLTAQYISAGNYLLTFDAPVNVVLPNQADPDILGYNTLGDYWAPLTSPLSSIGNTVLMNAGGSTPDFAEIAIMEQPLTLSAAHPFTTVSGKVATT